MIYAAQVDHGGRVKVHVYFTLPYFISLAGDALGIPSAEKSMDSIRAAAAERFAYYEIFATEWHAATAIKADKVPSVVADKLAAAIENRQRVSMRSYEPKGPK